ncbi:MAG: DUF4339 domain-containing protein [Pirellulales bacterium]|nr:DUF4339 domain-containing protein [Pirellulales bacterium]
MPIQCKCPGCGQTFQAPDQAAGRRAKCPKCATVIEIGAPIPGAPTATSAPPPAEPGWFVRTSEDEEHGPMSKAQLDQWVADGRVDEFCHLRRADWDHWKWIEEVYVQFQPVDAEPLSSRDHRSASGIPDAASAGRLEPCPDCGNMISRRATQCPHCGCPVQARNRTTQARNTLGQFASSEESCPTSTHRARRRNRRTIVLSVLGCLLVVVLGSAAYVGYQLWRGLNAVVELRPAPPPPDPPKDDGQDTIRKMIAYKREVAEAQARAIDKFAAALHENSALFQPTQEYSNMLQSLASGDLDSLDKAAKQSSTPPSAAKPYVSQYETLLAECQKYLDAQVPNESGDFQAVQSAGAAWAAVKREQIPKQIVEGLQKQ